MKKFGFWSMLVTIFIGACQMMPAPIKNETSRNTEFTPTAIGPFDIPIHYTEIFLIEQVGWEYYLAHYRLLDEARMGEYLIKGIFVYSYEPYVRDYEFAFWLDFKNWQPCPEDRSCILLDPQEFLVSPEVAKEIARQNGMPSGYNLVTRLVIDDFTKNRFAWQVSLLEEQTISVMNEGAESFVCDVETGQVYLPNGLNAIP